jgi:multicomponent Na+:H+ antiporter subunit F
VTDLYIAIALAELVLASVVGARLALGPSVSDRIVALNTLATQVTLALMFFSAYADRTIYLDLALWLGSFSYLGTLVWARFLEREFL